MMNPLSAVSTVCILVALAICVFLVVRAKAGQAPEPEGLKLLMANADKGDAQAQFNLGLLYQRGDGVPKDYGKAVSWYRKSAEQGDPFGQLYFGICYAQGWGVVRDYGEAAKWYRLSAEQGRWPICRRRCPPKRGHVL